MPLQPCLIRLFDVWMVIYIDATSFWIRPSEMVFWRAMSPRWLNLACGHEVTHDYGKHDYDERYEEYLDKGSSSAALPRSGVERLPP